MNKTKSSVKKNASQPKNSLKEKSSLRFEPEIIKEIKEVYSKNPMSEPDDRGDDLMNEVDPFTQKSENSKKALRIDERSL